MRNRLLENMKNKVAIIDGAIGIVRKFMNDETVTVHGLHTMTFGRGSLTNEQLQQRINELRTEKQNLLIRINRFKQ